MIDMLVDRLVRIPAAVVAAALVVGAVMADVHTFVVSPAIEGAEPAQWTARVGIMLYYLLLPLGLLGVWARRRDSLGRVGRVAAVLLGVQVLCYLLLTVATLLWGLVLGRGDLSSAVMWVETLGLLSSYLGVVVLGVRLVVAGRANAVFVVLAAVFLVQQTGSRAVVAAAAAR